MRSNQPNLNRREFLAAAAAGAAAATAVAAEPSTKKTVAAVVTEYRPLSHADVIVGRILDGYSPNNQRVEPRTRIVSMYTDQIAAKDMSRDLSAKHGFKIYPTVAEALQVGGDKLAVDAVLLVGEHGKYPTNDRGQTLYPRYELFEKIVEVFRRDNKSVPVFSDKHLSYSWDKAKKMYDWSRELHFPFMAGSSIPVTVRRPDLEIPYDANIEHAVVVGYGGLDAYGFHTVEALQCMVERRAGGEKGIASVEWLEGDAVAQWRDSDQGRWSAPLLKAAVARNLGPRKTRTAAKASKPTGKAPPPVAFLLEYVDGFRAVAYMLPDQGPGWTFAAKLKDRPEPVSTHFGFVDEGHRTLPHFDGLVKCIEDLFVTGKPDYPVERTLLTTGALALLFESRVRKQKVETPELAIRYHAPRDTFYQRS
jgi:hypothetical protein